MIPANDKPTVDITRMAELEDGWLAAVVIHPDGQESCWVLLVGGDNEPHGCTCAECAPHEQLGTPVFPNRKATS